MVDPTWENTSGGVDYFNKFDLNHFVLAKKGFSSTGPFVSDDVGVSISEGQFVTNPKVEVAVDLPEAIWAGFSASVPIRVLNQGNLAQSPQSLIINSQGIENLGPSSVELGVIPPFGSTTYKINLKTPFVWQSFDSLVEVKVAGQTISKKVTVKPFFLFYPFPYVFGGLITVIAGIYFMTLVIHLRQKSVKLSAPGK